MKDKKKLKSFKNKNKKKLKNILKEVLDNPDEYSERERDIIKNNIKNAIADHYG